MDHAGTLGGTADGDVARAYRRRLGDGVGGHDGARQCGATVRRELESYGAGLADKPEIVVLNKCDALSDADIAEGKAALGGAARARVLGLSGLTGLGMDELVRTVRSALERCPQPAPAAEGALP